MRPNLRQTTFSVGGYQPRYTYRSLGELASLVAMGVIKRISLDIESTPRFPYTEALDPWKGDIRLVGIYCRGGSFFGDLFNPKDKFEFEELLKILKLHNVEVIVHHAWFEGVWILFHFKTILNYRCTIVLHRVATAGQRLPADLHSVCNYYGIEIEDFEEDKKKLQLSAFGGKISLQQIDYVLSDAKKAWDCFEVGIEKYPWPLNTYQFECNNLPIFIEMGVTGLPVDVALAEEILAKIENTLRNIEKELGYNPGSRLVLRRLFTDLGFIPRQKPGFFKSKTPDLSILDEVDKKFLGVEFFEEAEEANKQLKQENIESLDSEYLSAEDVKEKTEKIVQQFDDTVLLIAETKFPKLAPWRKIRAYRRIQWNQAYIKAILLRVVDGRVRPKILPIAQSGYRVSVNSPNLANSIKDNELLREYKIAPGRIIFAEKGMISTDGPAAHIRALIQLSRDPFMCKAVNRGDVHSQTAATIAKFQGHPEWDFNFISRVKDDKKHPDHFAVKQLRAGAKEFIYLWLNGGQAIKAIITLATGAAKYRFKEGQAGIDEAQTWIRVIDNSFPCAAALKSLLSDGPIKNDSKRRRLLKDAFGIEYEKYLQQLQFVVDDNHILNSLGKYTHLQYLPFNARIIAPWMSAERVWITSIAQEVYRRRFEIGYAFSSWQHDEFIGRAVDPKYTYDTTRYIEEIALEVSRNLVGFSRYYKDGDPDSPTVDKEGNRYGDFSAKKMMINNLTEK